MNQLDTKGRKAIVTGGAAGIGLAIAERLKQSGADVMVWDLDISKVDSSKFSALSVDTSDYKAVCQATQATEAKFGRIDILVCSAGIAGPVQTTIDFDVDAWRKVFDINMHGVFYCNKEVAKVMLKNDYGRIVNIASIAGKEGNPNASAYSASKAGVIGLTKSIGKELAKSGVRVNCVTPAAVRTAIFDQITQSHIDFMLSKIPIGRLGMVDEIAACVSWLCTEDCSFSTGAVFDLSGGRATY
jgi:2-dehydro-3-deoxy-L-rhamnonate dehydrogenase (NAD+)